MKRVFVSMALVVSFVAVGIVFAGVSSASRARVESTAETFYPGLEQTFSIPAAGRIDVTLVAGAGGENADLDSFGGYGSVVTATINVNPGTLYVDVGSNGGDPAPGLSGSLASGGTGGTHFGSCCYAGGGGGASVIATCSANSSSCRSLYFTGSEPRLAVAGGGGGGGGDDGCNGGNAGGGTPSPFDEPNCTNGGGGGGGTGGNGRDVTGLYAGHPSTIEAGGGHGASQSAAGAGGSSTDGNPGHGGSGPYGGNGYTGAQADQMGGGGGGGYYGGGGGGTCFDVCDEFGAGGGAGSSWVVAGARNITYGNDTSGNPYITITYTPKIHKV